MKPLFILISMFMFAAAALPAPSSPLVSQKTGMVRIDGTLDDPVWKQAKFYHDFTLMDTDKPAGRRTEFAIACTSNELIFGFRAYVPDDKIKTAKLFSECVEIMVDPQGTSETYFHFAVGANGQLFDRKCEQSGYVGNETYESGFRAKVVRGKGVWTAEVAIPFRSLELRDPNPEFWAVNCARESGGELSAIGEKGRFNVKSAFRKMIPPAADLSAFFWEPGEPKISQRVVDGKLAVSCEYELTNLTGKSRQVCPELLFSSPSGRQYPLSAVSANFVSGEKAVIKFPEVKLSESGVYRMEFSLRDAQNNKLLVRKYSKQKLEFVPLAINVIDPHYRNAIFATQKLDKVRCQVIASDIKPGMSILAGIRKKGNRELLCRLKKAAANTISFEFPVAPLPEGRLEIAASLIDAAGKTVTEAAVPIRKLPYLPGEVWRGKDRNWYIDGKKVFLLLSWNIPGFIFPEFLAMHGKNPNFQGRYISSYGFGLVSAGIHPIIMKEGYTPHVEKFLREKIRKALKDPKLIAHYWQDEPDCTGMSREIAARGAAIAADEDPWHPVILSTGTAGIINYPDGGEINGFHCYPKPIPGKPMSNFKKIVVLMDRAKAFFGDAVDAQTITFMHQGFNYGEYFDRNTRIPSYEEYRNQNILALILGAQGLLHYNVFSGDYPELFRGIPELVKEQKIIGEEAVIQTPVKTVSPSPELRLRAFRNEQTGAVWLLACNAGEEEREYRITLKEFGNAGLQVLSENRFIDAKQGIFSDRFTPFAVHVYTTDQRKFNLKTVAEINELIESDYRRLAKKGNLAWQRLEEEKLKVSASSNARTSPGWPQSNALWHVTDGFTKYANPQGAKGALNWCDATPNKVPDWIELNFFKTQTVGRIKVYPEDNSLRDYEVQIFRNGNWEKVGEVKDASGEFQEFKFHPMATRRIRVLVTGNNGKNSKINEIEVYKE